MEHSTVTYDDSIQFTDRWEDTVTFEYEGSGILVVLGTNSVRLEKSQVVALIKALVGHIAE